MKSVCVNIILVNPKKVFCGLKDGSNSLNPTKKMFDKSKKTVHCPLC